MHNQVASPESGIRILELGAGTLNHVSYENRFEVYDIVEPFRQLWQDSPRLAQVSAVYEDISHLPAAKRYDRIISIAVLEHLVDLPFVIADCGLRLAEGGELRAGIPTEGGFLWSLGWRSTTGLSFRLRTGLSYEPYIRHEHVNLAEEVIAIVGYFFQRLEFQRFPLPMKHLSLYTALRASCPYLDRCAAFRQDRTLVNSSSSP